MGQTHYLLAAFKSSISRSVGANRKVSPWPGVGRSGKGSDRVGLGLFRRRLDQIGQPPGRLAHDGIRCDLDSVSLCPW